MSVAISLRTGGLVTPTIPDADRLSLDEMMERIRDYTTAARSGTLRSEWMRDDSTITVTNLGERGADLVHGLISPPEVALVGFGRILERPWVVDGAVVPRSIVNGHPRCRPPCDRRCRRQPFPVHARPLSGGTRSVMSHDDRDHPTARAWSPRRSRAIAPDVADELPDLDPDIDLFEEYGLDSMDRLNIMTALTAVDRGRDPRRPVPAADVDEPTDRAPRCCRP